MACPQVVDSGQGHQIWRVATNILNKQSRTAKSLSQSGVGREVDNTWTSMCVCVCVCVCLRHIIQNATQGLGLGVIFLEGPIRQVLKLSRRQNPMKFSLADSRVKM